MNTNETDTSSTDASRSILNALHSLPTEKSDFGQSNNQTTTTESVSMVIIPMDDVDVTKTVVDFNIPNTSTTVPINVESERHDYSQIQPYWFYSKKSQGRVTWIPFSLTDVRRLDEAYAQ
ncbi:unnamed protein product, partial [Rotaria sp. Silwood1]